MVRARTELPMKCPNHITRDTAGYCGVCGSFFCSECLNTHEGVVYCPKHFKPIAEKLKREEALQVGRKRHGRHQLVVQFVNGSKAQGVCRSLNPREAGFYLEIEDDNGYPTSESVRAQFVDIKYVAHVKSYDGQFDKSEDYQQYNPGGTHVVVRYPDGEVIEGVTMQAYVPGHPRFYLIPADRNSNFLSVLVEAGSVERVYTPDEYRARVQQEKEARRQQKEVARASSGGGDLDSDSMVMDTPSEPEAALSQEESMGDFYFETHNYTGALEQYQNARRAFPNSVRLRRKAVVATVNIGIQYIKSREYPKALVYMEQALELEPKNPHARKKAKQLQKVIEKTERRMREYYEQQSNGARRDGGDDEL